MAPITTDLATSTHHGGITTGLSIASTHENRKWVQGGTSVGESWASALPVVSTLAPDVSESGEPDGTSFEGMPIVTVIPDRPDGDSDSVSDHEHDPTGSVTDELFKRFRHRHNSDVEPMGTGDSLAFIGVVGVGFCASMYMFVRYVEEIRKKNSPQTDTVVESQASPKSRTCAWPDTSTFGSVLGRFGVGLKREERVDPAVELEDVPPNNPSVGTRFGSVLDRLGRGSKRGDQEEPASELNDSTK